MTRTAIVVVEDVDGVRYPADVFCSTKKAV